ncbi:MAG: LysO family transporter [Pyrobaculum sp.]|nr:LysO family transporter [Pyrobaculum sp.]
MAIAKYVVPIVLGYAAGWALKRRPPGFLFTAVVVVLVFFVAANAAAVVLRNIGVFLALSILYSLALVFITAVLGSFLNKPETVGAARRPVISLYVAAALAAGLAVGASAEFNYASAIDPLLLFLLFIAGADMAHVEVRLDRSVFLAPAVAFLGAGVVGFLFALAFHITPAVALGMGWYSFTGPYLASAGDAVGGAYGLLVNFLREQFTFLLGPVLARRFSKVGVLAVGGATTMDNTLPLYTALYGSSFALYAFANGVILTALVPVMVPVIHQFYICCM